MSKIPIRSCRFVCGVILPLYTSDYNPLDNNDHELPLYMIMILNFSCVGVIMTHYWPLIAPEKNEGMMHMIFHWFSNSPFELVARCLSIIKIPLFGSQDKELPEVGWVEICWNCEQVTVHVCSLNADLNGLISWKHTFWKMKTYRNTKNDTWISP